jgi:hypothetical protein
MGIIVAVIVIIEAIMVPRVVIVSVAPVGVIMPRAIIPRVIISAPVTSPAVVPPAPAKAPVASSNPDVEIVEMIKRVGVKPGIIPDDGHGVIRVTPEQELGVEGDVRGRREPPVAVIQRVHVPIGVEREIHGDLVPVTEEGETFRVAVHDPHALLQVILVAAETSHPVTVTIRHRNNLDRTGIHGLGPFDLLLRGVAGHPERVRSRVDATLILVSPVIKEGRVITILQDVQVDSLSRLPFEFVYVERALPGYIIDVILYRAGEISRVRAGAGYYNSGQYGGVNSCFHNFLRLCFDTNVANIMQLLVNKIINFRTTSS